MCSQSETMIFPSARSQAVKLHESSPPDTLCGHRFGMFPDLWPIGPHQTCAFIIFSPSFLDVTWSSKLSHLHTRCSSSPNSETWIPSKENFYGDNTPQRMKLEPVAAEILSRMCVSKTRSASVGNL
jgi:hypothetical protein